VWDINHTASKVDDQDGGSSGSSSSSGYDGVLMFEPHRDYVSSMKWLGPSGQGLLTGSYDGVVRRLDVETGGQGWCVLFGTGEGRGGTIMACMF
jgi:WD40 repeat protein